MVQFMVCVLYGCQKITYSTKVCKFDVYVRSETSIQIFSTQNLKINATISCLRPVYA